jgi:hypothetical protein
MTTTTPSPRKIILDTDPGVDDVLAILLALASPEVDVRLISIVFGNTHAPVAHANLLKIYHLLASEVAAIPEAAARYGRLDGQGKAGKTVLAVGEDGPIGGEKAVAAYFVGPVVQVSLEIGAVRAKADLESTARMGFRTSPRHTPTSLPRRGSRTHRTSTWTSTSDLLGRSCSRFYAPSRRGA